MGAKESPCYTLDCILKQNNRQLLMVICPEVECRMLRMSVVKETRKLDLMRQVCNPIISLFTIQQERESVFCGIKQVGES